MQAKFSVPLSDAQSFQKVWTYKGLSIPLPPEAANFAKDFADIVLKSFIEMAQQHAKQEKKVITEGVE